MGTWQVTPQPAASGNALVFNQSSTTLEVPPGSTSDLGSYTATYTYTAPNGCPATASTVITIIPSLDCPREYARFDERITCSTPGTPVVFSSTRQWPQGRGTYLVECPIVLEDGDFIIEPGSTWYFEAGASVTVGRKASLWVMSSTLTAACDQMWDGIYVLPNSLGMTLTDGRGGPSIPTPSDVGGAAATTNEISHSLHGIVWERPDLTPLIVTSTRFLHNRVSITCGPYVVADPSYVDDGLVPDGSAIVNCVFDSDPAAFLFPFAGMGMVSHIHMLADAWPFGNTLIAGNRFGRGLVGILSDNGSDRSMSGVVGPHNLFDNNTLAGIHIRTQRSPLTIELNKFNYPDARANLRPYAAIQNFFTVPAEGMPWDYNQKATRISQTRLASGTAGIHAGELAFLGELHVLANEFTQAIRPTNLNTLGGTTQQTGIEVGSLHAPYQFRGNTFKHLGSAMYLSPQGAGAPLQAEIEGNLTTDCRVGLWLENSDNLSTPSSQWPIVWPHCNTFRRAANSSGNTAIGVNYGIALAANTRVLLDHPAHMPPPGISPTEVMTNYFDDASGLGLYRWIYNPQANVSAGFTPIYTAFLDTALAPVNGRIYATQYLLKVDFTTANSPNFNVIVSSDPAKHRYDDNFSCITGFVPGLGFNAPPRPLPTIPQAPSTGFVIAEPTPNPVSGILTLVYDLTGARQAELVLRDLLTGQCIKRQVLVSGPGIATMQVTELRPGVYACTILADGQPIITRRVLIQH